MIAYNARTLINKHWNTNFILTDDQIAFGSPSHMEVSPCAAISLYHHIINLQEGREKTSIVQSSWLYSLRKEELSEIRGALDLDAKGTVEDMRKAVPAFIATSDLEADMKMKLTELEIKYAAKTLHLSEVLRRASKDLAELIALGERLEDLPAATVASLPRETPGPARVPRVNAPTTTNTSRNFCLRCAQPGHFGLGMDFLAKAGTTTTMDNTTVNITKYNEAQRPISTHRFEQPSQPTNCKLARQVTNDNAERADIENMIRFDQPEPVKSKREFLIRHSNTMEVNRHRLEMLTTANTNWQHRWTTQETINSYQNYEQRSSQTKQSQLILDKKALTWKDNVTVSASETFAAV
uniref:Uncharacterized protein n=1 Tax=Glossina pallidipes TaxID=7398 RepID=A0A1A9ZY68_GLOPL